MKRVLILLLIVYPEISNSQIFNSDTLATIAYWEQGESYKYQLDKYRYRQEDDSISEVNSRSFISFDIKEETDTSYLIRFSIDSLKIQGELEENPIMSALTSDIASKLNYLIETDENGTLIGLRNWSELKDKIIELMSTLEIFSGMNEEEKEQAEQAIRVMTDSKDRINSMFNKEFAVLFSNYGYVFDTRDTIEYSQHLPNPYGGNPFPQAGRIYFDSSSVDSTGTIVLYDESAIDEKEGKKAIVEVMKKLSPHLIEAEEELNKIEFRISDSTVQEFDISNGSITFATMQRKVTSQDLKKLNVRIDRQTWQLLKVINRE